MCTLSLAGLLLRKPGCGRRHSMSYWPVNVSYLLEFNPFQASLESGKVMCTLHKSSLPDAI